MKKSLSKVSILLFICFLFSPTTFYAKAEQTKNYYRVIKEDAPFYESSSMQNILFFLEYTYYVNVIAEHGDLFQIEVFGDQNSPSFIGYTKKENLFKDDLAITNPYPSLSIKTCTSTVLYTDTHYLNKQVYLFAERNYTYYGKNYDNANNVLYLIGYEDKIGYVKESSVYPFIVENHPNKLTFLQVEEPKQEVPTVSPNQEIKDKSVFADENTLIKVGIICSLIVAGGIGLYVVTRKKEVKPKHTNYYDENEYE